jgi:hypothetical protein
VALQIICPASHNPSRQLLQEPLTIHYSTTGSAHSAMAVASRPPIEAMAYAALDRCQKQPTTHSLQLDLGALSANGHTPQMSCCAKRTR